MQPAHQGKSPVYRRSRVSQHRRVTDIQNSVPAVDKVDHHYSLVRYVILAISVAKIDFIVFMASLGVK